MITTQVFNFCITSQDNPHHHSRTITTSHLRTIPPPQDNPHTPRTIPPPPSPGQSPSIPLISFSIIHKFVMFLSCQFCVYFPIPTTDTTNRDLIITASLDHFPTLSYKYYAIVITVPTIMSALKLQFQFHSCPQLPHSS